MTGTEAEAQDAAGRHRWADVARGGCVVLVVLHHLTTKQYDLVLADGLDWAEDLWLGLTWSLKPLRMPLFFALSGFFAARALARPWRDTFGTRVVGAYLLYAMWLCVHAVIFAFATTLPMNRTQNLEELALDLVYASTSMWYLYALPVYFLVTKLLRRREPLLLAVAAGLALWATLEPFEAVNRVSLLENYLYFVAGAARPQLLRRVAASRRRHLVVALALAYVAASGVLRLLEVPRGPMILLLSAFAVPLAIRCSVSLSRWRAGGSAVAWVGRRTLPVYVLHVPLIALLHQLLSLVAPLASSVPTLWTVAALLYPVAATALITVGALLAPAALARCGLGWLFRRPSARAVQAATRQVLSAQRAGPGT